MSALKLLASVSIVTIISLTGFPQVSLADEQTLAKRLGGFILLQVEQHGEAWYVRPDDGLRYYMEDGAAAYQIMRQFGLGITDVDLEQIPFSDDATSILGQETVCSTNELADRVKGKILLQVEQHGEAWYVDPRNCWMIYLEDGAAAYEIMRFLSLGITDSDLGEIVAGSSVLAVESNEDDELTDEVQEGEEIVDEDNQDDTEDESSESVDNESEDPDDSEGETDAEDSSVTDESEEDQDGQTEASENDSALVRLHFDTNDTLSAANQGARCGIPPENGIDYLVTDDGYLSISDDPDWWDGRDQITFSTLSLLDNAAPITSVTIENFGSADLIAAGIDIDGMVVTSTAGASVTFEPVGDGLLGFYVQLTIDSFEVGQTFELGITDIQFESTSETNYESSNDMPVMTQSPQLVTICEALDSGA